MPTSINIYIQKIFLKKMYREKNIYIYREQISTKLKRTNFKGKIFFVLFYLENTYITIVFYV